MTGQGGEYTYRQLESLWLSAGGRRSLAPTMAAIAEAESGGNRTAANPAGTSGPNTAEGPWQIRGAVRPGDQSRLFNVNVNAREAVLKERTQGLGAWTTYTSGAFRKFLQGGNVPSAGVQGGQAFVDEAQKFIGTPYVWGGESPKGFDCSGLVQYAAQKVGIKNVPRTSEAQYAYVQHISRTQLKPGDLVFYAGSDGTAASPGHVAIYAGNGQVIQAPHTGANVEKSAIGNGAVGYGRLPGVGGADFTGATGGGGGGSTDATLTSIPIVGGLLDILGFGPSSSKTSDVARALATISNNLARIEQGVLWFFVPNHWVRIICGVIGVPLVGIGIVTMTKGAQPVPVSAGPVSTEVSGGQLGPAIGIAEVTIGAVLLFVAFHNLQAQGVNDWPGLVSYFQNALQGQGAQPTSGSGQ